MIVSNVSEEELLEYSGMGYMPNDFEEYWKRAIAEMHSVDPKVEVHKVDTNFKGQECFELFFTGVKGARIHGVYMRPKGAVKAAVIFKFHGYSSKSDSWYDMLPFVSQGHCVAEIDCRGQGGKSEDVGGVVGNTLYGHIIRGLESDNSDDLLYRNIFLDTVELVKIVGNFNEIDKDRMYSMGDSQGGGLAIACAALSSQIKKTVVLFPFLSDYKYAYLNIDRAHAFSEIKDYFRLFDPCHEKAEDIFKKLGYIDIQNLAKFVNADVLMASGMRDVSVPVQTQFAMYNKLRTNKKFYLYPEQGHEKLPGFNDIALQWLNE